MKNKKQSVALSSVFASLLLTLIKIGAGIASQSIGILSEAAHSALDFGAALLTYFAVRIGDRPADETHPYGHAKVESVSALIETGLLFITSFYIIYESLHRLFFRPVEVSAGWYSFVVIIISIVVDISRSRALKKTAKETGSQALEADALHFSSDIWSSALVLIGLVLVRIGVGGADAIAALGVALFVIAAGYRLGKRTIDVLVDAAPADVAEKVKKIIASVKEISSTDRIRVRPLGLGVFIDLTVSVSRKFSLEKVDAAKKKIKARIREEIPEADIVIHARPIRKSDETAIEALQVIAARHGTPVHGIVIDRVDGRDYLSYHIELAGNLPLAEAHKIASRIETAFKKEMGPDTEINSHIEPLAAGFFAGRAVPEEERAKMEWIISGLAEKEKLIFDVHDFSFRESGGRLVVSFHCHVDREKTLEEIHAAVAEFEDLIKSRLPGVSRVIAHAEPMKEKE